MLSTRLSVRKITNEAQGETSCPIKPRTTRGDIPKFQQLFCIRNSPTQDKICYNCVNQGHVSRTCPIKSRLCSEIDFSPGPSKQRPSLYDLGQEEYFGRGDETTEGKGVTIDTGVELLSVSFRGLAPHGGVGKPKTKAELKTFPKTTLMFPVSIRLNLGSTIFQPGMTSADDNNKSPCESESSGGCEPYPQA